MGVGEPLERVSPPPNSLSLDQELGRKRFSRESECVFQEPRLLVGLTRFIS